jgi:glycosyltransferase involved in cell wall biosynthesis
MNILMVALLDPHGESAGKTHFLSLCRLFAKRGHTITTLLPRMDDWQPTDAKLRSHKINTTWSVRLTSPSLEWLLLGWWRTLQIVCVLLRTKPDTLYVRNRTSIPFLCFFARILSPRLNIISEHPGWVAYQLQVCNAPNWKQRLAAWSQLLHARYASKIRVVSKGIGTILVEHGIPESRIFVVGNGTDLEVFHPMPKADACAQIGLDPQTIYIGFAGLLERWQGIDILIEAAALYLPKHPDTKLLIVGSGPEQTELIHRAEKLHIADKCVFTGHVPHGEMPYYINCFSLAVLFKYGLDRIANGLYSSLKLRDYSACGIPILASDGASDHDVIANEHFGTLVNLDDVEGIAAALFNLLTNKTKLIEMGERGHHIAAANFSWTGIADQILTQIQPDQP